MFKVKTRFKIEGMTTTVFSEAENVYIDQKNILVGEFEEKSFKATSEWTKVGDLFLGEESEKKDFFLLDMWIDGEQVFKDGKIIG